MSDRGAMFDMLERIEANTNHTQTSVDELSRRVEKLEDIPERMTAQEVRCDLLNQRATARVSGRALIIGAAITGGLGTLGVLIVALA